MRSGTWGTLFSGAHYNGFGALLSGSLGNGIAETRAYYGRGWLQSVSATLDATTVCRPHRVIGALSHRVTESSGH